MSELNKILVEFDFNKEQLELIKQEALAVEKTNIPQVEETIKKLVKVRRAIQAKGKEYRDDANAFNKSVLSKEKEYVEIIEPVELDFKKIVEDDKQNKIIAARRELLPNRKKHLSLLKVAMPTDEEILQLDDAGWVVFYDSKVNEHEKAVEHEKRKEQDEKDREEREKKIAQEAADKAMREAEEKARKDKEEAERLERERIAKEEEEKAKLEAGKKYKAFLAENSFDEKTDILKRDGDSIKIYRFVAQFNIKK